MTSRFIIGDTRDVLRSLPDASVDLVMSSPPFLALRSYLPADHPDKAREIGSEPTPGAFLDTLLDVVEECARVLTPHGSLVFELGDTYAGSGDPSGCEHKSGEGGALRGNEFIGARQKLKGSGWPLAKSLCMIPSSFAWALSYGRNPWTGRETEPWRVRNLIAWCRPNPPVGALGDKFRPGTSYLTVACKSRARWFDLDAVRTPVTEAEWAKAGQASGESYQGTAANGDGYAHVRVREPNAAGAPPLDWWEIPTQPYAGSHYATFPEKLVVRPIESMCPRFVCRTCGEPRRRLVGDAEYQRDGVAIMPNRIMGERGATGGNSVAGLTSGTNEGVTRVAPTLGWSDCGHDDYRRGVTLDPFCGSGTTLAVAEGLGRDSIGVDLDSRNADLAAQRVGMFLTVETFEPVELGEEIEAVEDFSRPGTAGCGAPATSHVADYLWPADSGEH